MGLYLIDHITKNINSRPPTLLRQFDVLQIDLPELNDTRHLLLSSPAPQESDRGFFVLTSSSLRSYRLTLELLFDGKEEGLSIISQAPQEYNASSYRSEITDLVRTPDGRGLAIRRTDSGSVYSLQSDSIILKQTWSEVHDVVPLDKGSSFASSGYVWTYTAEGRAYILYMKQASVLELYNQTGSKTCTLIVPVLKTFFTVPSESQAHDSMILAVTKDFALLQININKCQLTIKSTFKLSLPTVSLVLPVDPMAWAAYPQPALREMILCATSDGELSFWAPESDNEWSCTGRVHTGRRKIRLARCSSAKKTVLGP